MTKRRPLPLSLRSHLHPPLPSIPLSDGVVFRPPPGKIPPRYPERPGSRRANSRSEGNFCSQHAGPLFVAGFSELGCKGGYSGASSSAKPKPFRRGDEGTQRPSGRKRRGGSAVLRWTCSLLQAGPREPYRASTGRAGA
ncbi:hypothetical protein BS50DRAFT_19261 [Corynespora cassiicola Philippines]|uniref:Uncharacterized protein n=1 Tax=Corynespora cassiicola Philippines TaxID=1448308 RepID=A0A2T2PA96_CORCC|nr:hypothetical protein BS50DRAFT_19261 [Corynespora cassiicola Philippines]